FLATMSPPDRAQADAEQGALMAAVVAGHIPRPLLELLTFPSAAGEPFVGAVLAAGGQARLDAAFKQPPTTSEVVLHPERYLAGDKAGAVAQPKALASAAPTATGALGEHGLRLVLEASAGTA